jgi:hypothetical protein
MAREKGRRGGGAGEVSASGQLSTVDGAYAEIYIPFPSLIVSSAARPRRGCSFAPSHPAKQERRGGVGGRGGELKISAGARGRRSRVSAIPR